MQFGAYTFVETRRDPQTGEPIDVDKSFADVLEQIELADRVGLDVFGLGEHHRPDYAVSAPAVALAAAAARTKRIRLTSAVTVLSSDDPVRVYQQFATLDLLSGGRAEIMAGRGSFIESFPLFGYNLDDYDELFAEKLELLLAIRAKPKVAWKGRHRAAAQRSERLPARAATAAAGLDRLRRHAAIGRARRHARPAAGDRDHRRRAGAVWRRWLSSIARRAAAPASPRTRSPSASTATASSPTRAEAAVDAFFPPYAEVMSRIGRERGWPPLTRAQFDQGRGPRGHLMVGTADEAIAKILAQHEVFGHQRYLMQMQVGAQPQAAILRSIELLGTVVAPAVRAELAKRKAPT